MGFDGISFSEIATSIVKLFLNLLNQEHLFSEYYNINGFMMAFDLILDTLIT